MRDKNARLPSQRPYQSRRASTSAEATLPLLPRDQVPQDLGDQQLPSLPPGQGGEHPAAGLPLIGADLSALRNELQDIQGHRQAHLEEEQSDPEDHAQELGQSLNNTHEPGYTTQMATAAKAKLDGIQNDIAIKTTTVKNYLTKNPPTASSKRQSKQHLDQLHHMSSEARQIAASYLDKVTPADKEDEQTRLNQYFARLEVANSDLQEDYQRLIDGDEDYRQAQNPAGTSMFKAFATKIETLDSQLDKLKSDMEAETGDLSVIRAKLYIDALERLRNTLEKDLPKVATDIQVVHTALNQAELDKLHGFDNDLQQKLQMATEQLAKLSLPATVNIRARIMIIPR